MIHNLFNYLKNKIILIVFSALYVIAGILMALLVLAYYPLESLIKGTFKLSKKEIIAMSIICVATVTINLLTYFADLRFIHL